MPSCRVKTIHVRTGLLVDRIGFEFTSGVLREWGGRGGSQQSPFQLNTGEALVRIQARNGDSLDGLQFITDRGRTSPWFGGHGGCPCSFSAPSGHHIVGLRMQKDIGATAKLLGIHTEPLLSTEVQALCSNSFLIDKLRSDVVGFNHLAKFLENEGAVAMNWLTHKKALHARTVYFVSQMTSRTSTKDGAWETYLQVIKTALKKQCAIRDVASARDKVAEYICREHNDYFEEFPAYYGRTANVKRVELDMTGKEVDGASICLWMCRGSCEMAEYQKSSSDDVVLEADPCELEFSAIYTDKTMLRQLDRRLENSWEEEVRRARAEYSALT